MSPERTLVITDDAVVSAQGIEGEDAALTIIVRCRHCGAELVRHEYAKEDPRAWDSRTAERDADSDVEIARRHNCAA
jgi:hypothetical protein